MTFGRAGLARAAASVLRRESVDSHPALSSALPFWR
jgi:hypothetical protein